MVLANAINNLSTGLQYLSSNGIFTAIANGTSTQIFSGVTSSTPTYNSYQQLTGLGIGASPGSTTGLTFDGSNFINNYTTGTWTPTMIGATTAGTTTYTSQNGYYTKLGNVAWVSYLVSGTAATGTGNVRITSIPFTQKNQTVNYGFSFLSQASYTWGAARTQLRGVGVQNTTNIQISALGSAFVQTPVNIANAAFNFTSSYIYQV